MRPLLLDLFCGAGGAAKGYHDAGFDVVGVDLEPQPNYPFEFLQADALEALKGLLEERSFHFPGIGYLRLADFVAGHGSPPCQAYTELNNDKSQHPRLIALLRALLEQTKILWVIENVAGAKYDMVNPVVLSGEMFGLGVHRPRLFETNWPLIAPEYVRKDLRRKYLVFEHGKWRWTANVPVYGSGGRKAVEYWPHAMGVGDTWDECWMTRDELAEAIPPAYTEWIGKQLLEVVEQRQAA